MNRTFIYLLACLFLAAVSLEASEVHVRGRKGAWYLEVDKIPFYVKGVGCGLAFGKRGEDYLKLAGEMGANSVRTWGTDQGTKEYLDQAQAYGLKVAAGIWLNYVDSKGRFSYLHNEEYKRAKRREVLDYVARFKSHPAILVWGLGNEAIFFTKDEDEKVALCRFMEELIAEIHKIDPDHPVLYASAGTQDLPYLKKYVPSLDIVGINEYGSIRTAHGAWDYLGFDKPYIFTEYGPYLSIDRPKDINGRAIELSDFDKAKRYKEFVGQIYEFRGSNLGGFAFHLGETTQESMTWWNLNEGPLKRASFWAIYEAYAGQKAACVPVRIKKLHLNKTKNLDPEETIEVKVDYDPQSEEGLVFEYAISTAEENVLEYYVNKYLPIQAQADGAHALIKAPAGKGTYRVYCFIKDKQGNVSSQSCSISVR